MNSTVLLAWIVIFLFDGPWYFYLIALFIWGAA
jgi:hypothetical protein